MISLRRATTRIPDRFYTKTWIYWAQVSLLGLLTSGWLVMGPLFLSGIIEPANGKPGTMPGVIMTLMGIAFLPIVGLAAYQILARKAPVIRLFREGLIFRQIGRTSFPDHPQALELALDLGLFRAAWAIVSLQGFRTKCSRIRWSNLVDVAVVGPPMSRTLVIRGTLEEPSSSAITWTRSELTRVDFRESVFIDPPDQIAQSILDYSQSESDRTVLPSWEDAAVEVIGW